MSDLTTWRKEIFDALTEHGETWSDVESMMLSDAQLDKEFDSDFGCKKGEAFTVWTKRRVYFPTEYDAAEWVASVSRHPDGKATDHI